MRTPAAESAADTPRQRLRNAAHTRGLLLEAARRRFAKDGYAATTVRAIAADADVNVALINRYFVSKELLFEACLTHAGEDLERPRVADLSPTEAVAEIVRQLIDLQTAEFPQRLLLLLRSSGDDRAEEIRRKALRHLAERMASATGGDDGNRDGRSGEIRAQIALATAIGIVTLRSSSGIEPLASATLADLEGTLGELFTALLVPPTDGAAPA